MLQLNMQLTHTVDFGRNEIKDKRNRNENKVKVEQKVEVHDYLANPQRPTVHTRESNCEL